MSRFSTRQLEFLWEWLSGYVDEEVLETITEEGIPALIKELEEFEEEFEP